MKKINILILLISTFFLNSCKAQNNFILTGRVYDVSDNTPLPYSKVILMNDTIKYKEVFTDFDGIFKFDSIQIGIYNLSANPVGYKPIVLYDIHLQNTNTFDIGFSQNIKTKMIKVDWNGGYISIIDSSGVFKCIKQK
ncbi:MAG: carboxypeptidase-like regulatory domain-containing protein [Methanolobus sp.]|nr:carboxypeptidase-like regulatory domain-containing protein [Methanolobus sp.]